MLNNHFEPFDSNHLEKMFGNCAVFLIVFVVAVKSDDECNLRTLLTCQEKLETIQQAHGHPVSSLDEFPDETFMNEYCSPGIQALECFVDVIQKCPDFANIFDDVFVSRIRSIVDLLHSVCDEDSELRKDYLENVVCYNIALPQMTECGESVENVLREFFDTMRNTTKATGELEPMDTICIEHQFFFDCAVKESTTICGAESTEPLENILRRASVLIKEIACPEKTLLAWELKLLEYVIDNGLDLTKRKKK